MLFLVVIAILLPAVFDLTQRITTSGANISLVDESLSLGISIVLLLIYAANLRLLIATSSPATRLAARLNGASSAL